MKKLCTAITLSLPLLFSSQLTQAEALKVLSSWDSSYVQTQVVEQFMDKLKTARWFDDFANVWSRNRTSF